MSVKIDKSGTNSLLWLSF